jgi:ABC-type amino acid transport substrate-binding protein
LGFAGQPSYVECADSLKTSGNCSDVVICVQYGTTHVAVVESLFPGYSGVVLAPTQQNLYLDFVGGQCNVIAGEEFDLSEAVVRQAGYTGNYSIGNNVFSNEPLSLVTRDDDAHWSDIVNWVVLGLLTAEVQHVTQSTAVNIINDPTASVNLDDVMYINAVATVGNYGEVYQRHLESIVPRAPVNMLNNGSSPLEYPIPFGNTSINGPGPVANGTLESILQRGYLRCGITTAAFFSGFNVSTQQWSGMDIDFCLAVSAALFQGTGSTIFVPVTAEARFQQLASGELDLLSRVTSITYDRDVKEPTTGDGFTFSQPDFYSGIQFGGIPP